MEGLLSTGLTLSSLIAIQSSKLKKGQAPIAALSGRKGVFRLLPDYIRLILLSFQLNYGLNYWFIIGLTREIIFTSV